MGPRLRAHPVGTPRPRAKGGLLIRRRVETGMLAVESILDLFCGGALGDRNVDVLDILTDALH